MPLAVQLDGGDTIVEEVGGFGHFPSIDFDVFWGTDVGVGHGRWGEVDVGRSGGVGWGGVDVDVASV